MATQRKAQPEKLVQFRCPTKLHREFDARARKNNRTLSQELRHVMQRCLEQAI